MQCVKPGKLYTLNHTKRNIFTELKWAVEEMLILHDLIKTKWNSELMENKKKVKLNWNTKIANSDHWVK